MIQNVKYWQYAEKIYSYFCEDTFYYTDSWVYHKYVKFGVYFILNLTCMLVGLILQCSMMFVSCLLLKLDTPIVLVSPSSLHSSMPFIEIECTQSVINVNT